ncbi:hypothetical protein NLG97_g6981 [Lecanicillium saksenae]|uniref:Uncharacterized protein n=1 Tax=Lecanicillium saksenae TaxID=468837 RepID=A0ACC1QPY4_9HYPO|nr:hypothetical protein NLG97_g6981 [Lecanicillium saksenae]
MSSPWNPAPDVVPPTDEFHPWAAWSEETREIFSSHTNDEVYDAMQFTTASERKAALRGVHADWDDGSRFQPSLPRNDLFDGNIGNSPVQCERCGTIYDQNMNPMTGPGENANIPGPVYEISFVYCPANFRRDCMANPRPLWNQKLTRLGVIEIFRWHQAIDIMSHMDPKYLISSVFGNAGKGAVGVTEIVMAYRALRVIWIRCFASHLPKSRSRPANDHSGHDATDSKNIPSDPQRSSPSCDSGFIVLPNGQKIPAPVAKPGVDLGEYIPSGKLTDFPALWIQTHFKGLSLWGDIQQDIFLHLAGHIERKELEYIYGLSKEALVTLNFLDLWASERAWIQAYAGMRRAVKDDQYQLMRTASQRLNTAMERFMEAKCDPRFSIMPQDMKLYAMNGVRFRELQSALCANTRAFRQGLRLVDRPDPNWWKAVTKETSDGKRIHTMYVHPTDYTVQIWKNPGPRHAQQPKKKRY